MTIGRKTFLRYVGIAAIGGLASGSVRGEIPGAALPEYRPEDPEPFWDAVRRLYRFEAGLTYFNTGGLGPCSLPVQQVGETVARELQTAVETGRARFEPARQVVARFFGAEPDEIAFVRNATEANGIMAAGLSLEPGDEVVFESHAHPGGSFPWLQQQERRGVVVRIFEPDPHSPEGNVARVQELLNPRTRVVQLSHVTAPTGIVLPVKAVAQLCRDRGIWCHVDGAQSAGMFPVHLKDLGCDSFATSGHKWLGAPHETGLLYVRRERLPDVQAPLVGAHSGEVPQLPGRIAAEPTARRFEYGTRNAAAVVALAAAVEWQDRLGPARIAARGRRLAAQLRAGLLGIRDVEVLTPVVAELSGSILTFRSPRLRFDTLFHRLFAEHQLRCRPVSEQGLDAVRVSCHLFNSPADVDRLIGAVTRELRFA